VPRIFGFFAIGSLGIRRTESPGTFYNGLRVLGRVSKVYQEIGHYRQSRQSIYNHSMPKRPKKSRSVYICKDKEGNQRRVIIEYASKEYRLRADDGRVQYSRGGKTDEEIQNEMYKVFHFTNCELEPPRVSEDWREANQRHKLERLLTLKSDAAKAAYRYCRGG
jgi:hypothetical protein